MSVEDAFSCTFLSYEDPKQIKWPKQGCGNPTGRKMRPPAGHRHKNNSIGTKKCRSAGTKHCRPANSCWCGAVLSFHLGCYKIGRQALFSHSSHAENSCSLSLELFLFPVSPFLRVLRPLRRRIRVSLRVSDVFHRSHFRFGASFGGLAVAGFGPLTFLFIFVPLHIPAFPAISDPLGR